MKQQAHLPQLESAVRHYSAGPPEHDQYDPNGVLHLLIAAIENISENYIDHDYEEAQHTLEPKAIATLQRLIGSADTPTTR